MRDLMKQRTYPQNLILKGLKPIFGLFPSLLSKAAIRLS